MAEVTEIVRGLAGIEDLLATASTAGTTQAILDDTGLEVNYTVTPVNTASLWCSSALVTLLGLSVGAKQDAAFGALAAGTGLQYASAAQNGQIYRMSAAPLVVGQPTAMEQNDARVGYIPTAAQKNAMVNSSQTPDYGNAFVTRYENQLAQSLRLGSGKDGFGKLGAVAANSTAPTGTYATTGLLTGTFTYKISAYNLSGAIVSSSASIASGAITLKQAVLTMPALPVNATGWRVFRSTDGITWNYVGSAILGYNYTETANDARRFMYTDNSPYPLTSQTAPGSDTTGTTATMSGLYEFIALDMTGATAITIATTGNYPGALDIRVQGTYTPVSGCTWSGVGANRAIGRLKQYTGATNATVDSVFIKQTVSPGFGFGPTFKAGLNTATGVARGIGADLSMIGQLLSGFGTNGDVTTGVGGTGGYGGGFLRIWAYQCVSANLIGTYNLTGQAGTAASGACAQGGGGGAGGYFDVGFVLPWKDSATENAAGGAGGAASGTGGAVTITGAPGGGGGAIIRRNCFDTSGATATVAAGGNGTSPTTATGTAPATYVFGGGFYGDGGLCTAGTAVTSATAGQAFALNAFNDPSWFGVA